MIFPLYVINMIMQLINWCLPAVFGSYSVAERYCLIDCINIKTKKYVSKKKTGQSGKV